MQVLSWWADKTVLVTGGTGSFGHAITKLLLREPIKALRVLSRDELKQSQMSQEITDGRLRLLLGDVRDRERLRRAFRGVDVVIHAAALKRIDMGDQQPSEFKKTNIDGTENVCDVAAEEGVGHVLALSTDKAEYPIGAYGASKLMLESLVIGANAENAGTTKYACARYGNVIASRGSIVPNLIAQKKTGTITLTDPRMTRFLISLPDAAMFVKRRIEEMRGGEVFVPRMAAVRVVDLIEAIAPGCEVKITGIREREKFSETLITLEESRCADLSHDGDRWFYSIGRKIVQEDAFIYASDSGDFLSVDEIRSALFIPVMELAA
jgi:UDP-N-acetylglucosamine 4,6-dehydratase